jgi:hypothetical protein
MECLQARPIPTKPGHEVLSGQSVLVRLGSHAHYLEYRSFKLNMCPAGPLASTVGVSFVVPNRRGDVRFSDIRAAKSHVRFAPKADMRRGKGHVR